MFTEKHSLCATEVNEPQVTCTFLRDCSLVRRINFEHYVCLGTPNNGRRFTFFNPVEVHSPRPRAGDGQLVCNAR